jgi:hypothetical protein
MLKGEKSKEVKRKIVPLMALLQKDRENWTHFSKSIINNMMRKTNPEITKCVLVLEKYSFYFWFILS